MLFKLGEGQLVPGLEEGIAKMSCGQICLFTIPPALGYGVIGLFALAFLVGVIAVRRVPRVQRVTPTEALQKYVAEGNFIDRSGME